MEKIFQKCLLIGGMVVAFWVMSLFITGIVNDRSKLQESTQAEIAQSWSSNQNFVGPVICVPVYDDALKKLPCTFMYVLPERYGITADVESETLHRGIFDASVYRTRLDASGTFNLKDLKMIDSVANQKNAVFIDWTHAQILTSITDKRGLEEDMNVKIGDTELQVNHRFHDFGKIAASPAFCGTVIGSSLVDLSSYLGKEDVPFNFGASLKGSTGLTIAPIGNSSVITMQGNCPDPSFNGVMLPSSREVSDEGFKAVWKISSLNRDDVEQVFYTSTKESYKNVGAKLLVMGSQYTQTDRALKYAFLVILLSLSAVFVAEMCVKYQINILNYLLIGAALVLFYLMLLSFGEWTGFSMAYFLSALLILGMITLYLKAIVRNGNVALATCSFMALVDIFIYFLLSIESMALLVGTLGLFAVLGVAMFFSLRFATISNTETPKQNRLENEESI